MPLFSGIFCMKRFVIYLFSLDSAIEREKRVPVIGVHRKLENFVVTLLVMRIFYNLLGASRACASFRDSTAESRFSKAHLK